MKFSPYKFIFGCAVIVTVMCSVTLVEISIHDCFPLYIKDCIFGDYQPRCSFLPSKTPDNLVLKLFCQNGENMEVLSAKYSMPASATNSCSVKDKNLDCNSTNICSCCTVLDKVCSVDSNILLEEMSKTCINVSECSITVPRFQFKKTDCLKFTWENPDHTEGNCDNTPQDCYSRWIDVVYMCHKATDIAEEQTTANGIDTTLICPLSLGSTPTDLPILGDDNWANFQVNITFPCDGSIKQVLYHRSVPKVPVYLGIWHTKPGGNMLLKHKVKLQSDTLGLTHQDCDPAVEVKSGDYVGIHHTMEYRHSVISHEANQDSQFYETLVVEVFDQDMMEGQELNLSGRKMQLNVNKQFAIQLNLGFQPANSLAASTTNKNVITGVIIGVTVAVVVVIAIAIITIITFRKAKRNKLQVAEWEGAFYLETSAINPYYHGFNRNGTAQGNNLPPLKQLVVHQKPESVYDEIKGTIEDSSINMKGCSKIQ